MTVLFVAGLSDAVDEALLDAWYSVHGDVHRTQVIRDKNSGRSLGYGFVELLDRDAAERAIGSLNGCEWEGRTLDVKLAANQRRRIPDAPRPETYYNDIYVAGIPFETTADDLRALFSSVADVRDVRMILNERGRPKGIAFLTVQTQEQAERAVREFDGRFFGQEWNGRVFGGRTLTVAFARPSRRAA